MAGPYQQSNIQVLMAYASSPITGSYLGNLVAEAYTLILRKWSGGKESETDIRNTFTFLISLKFYSLPTLKVSSIHSLLAIINKFCVRSALLHLILFEEKNSVIS